VKVEGWVKDLQLLSNYVQDDPQAAYLAFTKGLCSRWTYFQRTTSSPSLPLRHGGLGLSNLRKLPRQNLITPFWSLLN